MHSHLRFKIAIYFCYNFPVYSSEYYSMSLYFTLSTVWRTYVICKSYDILYSVHYTLYSVQYILYTVFSIKNCTIYQTKLVISAYIVTIMKYGTINRTDPQVSHVTRSDHAQLVNSIMEYFNYWPIY